jgi:predicted RND superfamily exporter protein
LVALRAPLAVLALVGLITALAVLGLNRLKVDDSLSELFRNNSVEFRQYEEIDRRFPSSEYDVLIVVEGPKLLSREGLAAFRNVVLDLRLAEGVSDLVSMLSARGKPDPSGYPPPIVPDQLPDGEAFAAMIAELKSNEIVNGKFLSADGQLALMVLALDRQMVADRGARPIIANIQALVDGEFKAAGLKVQLTGAPVMQLEIRNAHERDQWLYNGLGLLFGAVVAMFFFRSMPLMLLAALPPAFAVLWSLGTLGGLGFKLNLFLSVLTPLIIVMGFADSMQLACALRDRLRQGDSARAAARFVVLVVGPGCIIAHATTLVSFLALLLSDSALVRTFGQAGAIATGVSLIAVMVTFPMLARLLVRDGSVLAGERAPVDAAMDVLAGVVGAVVDTVVRRPAVYTLCGVALLIAFSVAHFSLVARYRLADQVPDREQAVAATSRLDSKLSGASPVHVMIELPAGATLYSERVLDLVGKVHGVLENEAGLGNVWSIESLRRWLKDAGDTRVETLKGYVDILPKQLTRRFVEDGGRALLVTARIPDVDASQILPVVAKINAALAPIRTANPGAKIWVSGLPAIAALSSSGMIEQLRQSLPKEVLFISILVGIAFRALFAAVISVLPALFPVVTAGAVLLLAGRGLEFSSAVAMVVIFGLGVDGLVHFLNRLRREEAVGDEPAAQIRRARILVGPAIILTTVVLAFGLGVTAFSGLPSLRLFGAVCVIALLASLVADLVLLPASIALYRRYFPVRKRSV